jgi:drug/metabolite transporter (DMT)-like permease
LTTESVSRREPLLPLVLVQFATCAAASFGAAAALGENLTSLDLGALSSRAAAEILYLAVLATGACLLVQAWAQRHTSSVRAAVVFMLEPVIAALLGIAVLGEHLTALQFAGAGVVVAGILAAETLGGPGAQA